MQIDMDQFGLTEEQVNYVKSGRGEMIIARKTLDESRRFSYASLDVFPKNSGKPHISIREITPLDEEH